MPIRALAHPIRLGIVCLLLDGGLSVDEIALALGTSQPNISQHLARLSDQRVLESRKVGTRIYYTIFDQRIVEIVRLLKETFCT